jgi:hypothetical protein
MSRKTKRNQNHIADPARKARCTKNHKERIERAFKAYVPNFATNPHCNLPFVNRSQENGYRGPEGEDNKAQPAA